MILFPPVLYVRFHKVIKLLLCFEFPLYNSMGDSYEEIEPANNAVEPAPVSPTEEWGIGMVGGIAS